MRRHTVRWVIALIVLCALAGVGCGASATRSTPPVHTAPAIGSVAAKIPLDAGSDKYAITVSDNAIWAHNFSTGMLLRIDPATNKLVATISVGTGVGNIGIESGFVWVWSQDTSTISKVDPKTNTVVDTINLPPPDAFLAVSPGAVWVASVGQKLVRRIDARSDLVVATIPIADGAGWMTYGAGSLWVCGNGGSVWRLDLATNKTVKQYDIGSHEAHHCAAIVAQGDTIWAEALTGDDGESVSDYLYQIDATSASSTATQFALPDFLDVGIAADTQWVWVFSPDSGLYRVNARTNLVGGPLAVAGSAGLALGDGSVWLATSDGTLLRITPAS